ncbi:MAG TPA: FtsQ-type POTRA domain-containing protein [Longimicrobiales bacterium]|nr:FtsQ-type POTRA domain-containing protein [Longimicrobiales bacterium]
MKIGLGTGLAVAAGAALVAAGVAEAPRVLRRVPAFEVRHVEVRGHRNLPPHHALATAGIRAGANLFEDRERWREALLVHPLVAGVEIRRKLPATLVLEIEETEPVLLVRTPRLVPVDGSGRALPIPPGHGSLDLPVLHGAAVLPDGRLADPALLAAVSDWDRLRRLDPGLAGRVSEVRADAGTLRLRLRRPADLSVLVQAEAAPEQLRRIEVVLAELERGPDALPTARLDARYSGQVVLALGGRRGEAR